MYTQQLIIDKERELRVVRSMVQVLWPPPGGLFSRASWASHPLASPTSFLLQLFQTHLLGDSVLSFLLFPLVKTSPEANLHAQPRGLMRTKLGLGFSFCCFLFWVIIIK